MSGFFVAVQRFVGRWIWRLCWKTSFARIKGITDFGTMVWVWAYRDYAPNAQADRPAKAGERGEL